jgi:hypothetical protein
MSHATQLAITLDEEMLNRNGVNVSPPNTVDDDLPLAVNIRAQIGGRFLMKYLRSGDRARFSVISQTKYFGGLHWVTPTPLCTANVVEVLCLPTSLPAPSYALILDPDKVEAYGPRRIRGGRAVEYLLKKGFPLDAIVQPQWPREIK